jgi:RND family efflux transporter MFP subunit
VSKKLLYPLLVLAGTIVLAWLLLSSKPAPQGESYIPPPVTVRTIVAHKRAEHLSVRSQGSVQPRSESQLIPEVSGRVTWMSPALIAGGSFSAEDILIRVDPADYKNAVAKGRAALTRSTVEREHAEDELARINKLNQQKLASQSQVDDAQRRFRVADANQTETRIDLEQSSRDLSRTEIVAPFAGRVRSEHVDLGQFVSRGNTIATLYATDYVEVRLPMSSAQLAFLEIDTTGAVPTNPGAPVVITGNYGSVKFLWDGEIVRTEAEIDSRSRMFYVVARIRNLGGPDMPPLAVGLFVQADIQGRLFNDIVRLPRSAMRDANQVLVVDDEGRLHFRQVSVLRIESDEVLISKGLENGERVCVSPLQTVVDGMRVQAVET